MSSAVSSSTTGIYLPKEIAAVVCHYYYCGFFVSPHATTRILIFNQVISIFLFFLFSEVLVIDQGMRSGN